MSTLVTERIRPGVVRRYVRRETAYKGIPRDPSRLPQICISGNNLGSLRTPQGLGAVKKTAIKTAQGAAKGASVGSAVPVIGTAIGAGVGAALAIAKGLFESEKSKAEKAWDAYKPGAGGSPGSAYNAKQFWDAVKGAFDANRGKAFKPIGDNAAAREALIAGVASKIVAAIKAGKVKPNETAGAIYKKVVWPFLKSSGKINEAEFLKNPPLTPLFVDITDRYLNNLPVNRATMPEYSKDKAYASMAKAPLILTALKGWKPPAAGTTKTPVSSSKPPAAGGTKLPGAALPAGVTKAQLDQLVKALAAQGLSQSQQVAAALQAMQNAGVPISPALQDAIEEEVSGENDVTTAGAGGLLSNPMLLGGLAIAGLLFAAARPVGGARRSRRKR